MYKLTPYNNVQRFADNAFIPFCIDNTDYQQFKKDLLNSVELQDPEGNIMTQEQIEEFLKTLP